MRHRIENLNPLNPTGIDMTTKMHHQRLAAGEITGMRLLTSFEIDFVIGGASFSSVGVSTEQVRRLALAANLQQAYIASHVSEYYGGYYG
jgi:hypothetical protein